MKTPMSFPMCRVRRVNVRFKSSRWEPGPISRPCKGNCLLGQGRTFVPRERSPDRLRKCGRSTSDLQTVSASYLCEAGAVLRRAPAIRNHTTIATMTVGFSVTVRFVSASTQFKVLPNSAFRSVPWWWTHKSWAVSRSRKLRSYRALSGLTRR